MPVAPLPAAAVLLTRPSRRAASSAPAGRREAPARGDPAPASAIEVFLARRASDQAFLGGFECFPGGRRDPADARIPVVGAAGEIAATVATAARELFEETGVLIARSAQPLDPAARAAARVELLAGRRDFAAVLAALDARLAAPDFVPAGRWVTPAYLPARFDTQYFLAACPPGQEATVIPGELAAGAWYEPQAALAAANDLTLLLPTPVRHALEALGLGDAGAAARLAAAPARHAAAEEGRVIELAPGLVLVPLATPTLPPAHATNCYVLGAAAAVIVDPGSPYPEEQAALDRALALLAARGTRPREVLLTHHHPDHVGGAAHLRARHGLPVAAHAATAARLGGVVAVDRVVADDEVIALPGTPPRRLRLLATPGHAPGHLAVLEETTGALCTGDLVATQGFIVVDPADGGDMAAYLASLRRARDCGARVVLPAHGLPRHEAPALFDHYLAHRAAREALVVAALARQAGPAPLTALLPLAYADTAPALWPLAARSLEAHLRKLEQEGRAHHTGDGWAAAEGEA